MTSGELLTVADSTFSGPSLPSGRPPHGLVVGYAHDKSRDSRRRHFEAPSPSDARSRSGRLGSGLRRS